MTLHRLASVTMGVPNVAQTAAYYTEFGLTPQADGWFSTTDGGRQLRIIETPTRRLVALTVGADHPDDLGRIAHNLTQLDIPFERTTNSISAIEAATDLHVTVEVQARITQARVAATPYNGPGRLGARPAAPRGCCGRPRSDPASSDTR